MNYDVLVVGGGVVGTAILHKLSQFDLKIGLLEKEPDLCEGISKANSAIVHTGFDAPPHTLESEALIRARKIWPEIINNHQLMFEKRGALMVALNEEEKSIIEDKYMSNASENGVEVEWISREEVLKRNPVVNPENIGGLLIKDESIVDPWETVYKFGEIAVENGADIHLETKVVDIQSISDGFTVKTNNETFQTKYVVNAAGLYSDNIARMVGDDSFTITPRKGQFIVTKSKVDIENIILPVPTPISKGKLIIPAVFKGHLLGPTAENHSDKEDLSTNLEGFEEIRRETSKLIPEAITYDSVKQYAGNRSVCSEPDFVIRPALTNSHFIHAAGIRSTGLSASPGIAEMVSEILEEQGLVLNKNEKWVSTVSKADEKDDEIICLTRNITKGQIKAVLRKPISPHNIDGIKRRTTVILGECQGSCCIPKIMDIMKEEGINLDPVKKDINSTIGVQLSKNKIGGQ